MFLPLSSWTIANTDDFLKYNSDDLPHGLYLVSDFQWFKKKKIILEDNPASDLLSLCLPASLAFFSLSYSLCSFLT
jgi:hypothetical protein